jgi:hypothetical protein
MIRIFDNITYVQFIKSVFGTKMLDNLKGSACLIG